MPSHRRLFKYSRRLTIGRVLAAVLTLGGCDSEPAGPKPIVLEVRGRATIAGSGEPAAGATIEIRAWLDFSNTRTFGTAIVAADGTFEVRGQMHPIYCNHYPHIAAKQGTLYGMTAIDDVCENPDQQADIVLASE